MTASEKQGGEKVKGGARIERGNGLNFFDLCGKKTVGAKKKRHNQIGGLERVTRVLKRGQEV